MISAFGLYSVIPVPARAPGRGVIWWMPVVGLVLAALACVPLLGVWRGGSPGAFLGAALVVVALALLTRGLHLDATADLVDGLGSFRPPEQARAIMRASDVGAFGAAAVAIVPLVQAAALSTVLAASDRPAGVVAVLTAAVTGRVAALRAAAEPASEGSSLGVAVAGTVGRAARELATLVLAVAAVAAAVAVDVSWPWALAAVLGALAVAHVVHLHAVRRLEGVSGDVLGACVEIGTAVCLGVLAAGTVWT